MTAGVGKWANNPGNLRCLSDTSPYSLDAQCAESPGNGYFSKFPTKEIGIYANVELLTRKYSGRDPHSLVKIWAGNPQSKGYWTSVAECYE